MHPERLLPAYSVRVQSMPEHALTLHCAEGNTDAPPPPALALAWTDGSTDRAGVLGSSRGGRRPPCAATLVRRASEFVQGSLGWRHLDSLSAQCKRGDSHRYMLTCLS